MKFYSLVALLAVANAAKLEQKPSATELSQESWDWKSWVKGFVNKHLVQVRAEDGSLVSLDDLNVPEYGFVNIDDSQNVMDEEDEDAEMQSDENPVEDEEVELNDADTEEEAVDLGDDVDLEIETPGDNGDVELLEQEVNQLE